jgi:Xaa-Pro aminopeptidase
MNDERTVLMVGDTLGSPDLRHAVPAIMPDPLIYLEHAGETVVYANSLDASSARDLPGIDVITFEELGATAEAADGSGFSPYVAAAVSACQAQGVKKATVPPRFPTAIAEAVAGSGVALESDEAFFAQRRRVKTPAELEGIRRANRAAEAGWDAVREGLREQPGVTSEELRARVFSEIARHDVVPFDLIIVSHGPQAAMPHHAGSGSVGESESVIADLIMRDRETGMYADVTRTFCVGEVPAEIERYFQLCREALEAAIAEVRAGAVADQLDAAASGVFEDAGLPTERKLGSEVPMDEGFYGGLGHGVGLEVHEAPFLHSGSNAELVAGEVLCLEPALYRRGFGGCRLEDMVLVTEDGCERITQYEYALEP